MTRLIKAEALAEALEKHEMNERNLSDYQYGINDGLQIAEMELEDAPTIDAIPVTRCRDCKYYLKSSEECQLINTRLHFYEADKKWSIDSFCSWAERKEE